MPITGVKLTKTLFDLEKIHTAVRKKYARHLTFIHGKIAEALLLLEAAYLDGKQRDREKRGDEINTSAHLRIGVAKTDVQQVAGNRQKEAEKLHLQAKELLENDLPYDAGQYLKTALVYNPFHAPSHHLLANIYLKMIGPRSRHMAEREFKLAVENDPWNANYILDLAKLYIEENMHNRARTLLDQAQRIDPQSDEVREMREYAKKVETRNDKHK